MQERNIVVAVSGASGSIYAKQLLEALLKIRPQWKNCALVFSKNAQEVWKHELGDFNISKEFNIYDRNDFHASFASGSSRYDTMIICPASMGMLARITHGISDDLITRAADVMLKERRKLILVPREMPFSQIHLENMLKVTQAGGIVCPAIPSFYHQPKSIEELVNTVVERVLSISGFDLDTRAWGE
jgi:4-hydroxy-3-polyprenylbenzoate decarboxylase